MGGLGPCGRSGLFSVETSFRMQGKRRVQAMLGYFPKEHRFRIHAESTGSLCGRLRQEFPHLEEQVEEWILSLPQVGDEQILRPLVQPGRGDADEKRRHRAGDHHGIP